MKLHTKKVSARATALALALGVVGVLVTALPAYAAVPTISLITPTGAAVGCQVTVTGANFAVNGGPATAITFGAGTAGTIVSVDSDSQLEATIAGGTVVGAGNVVVTSTGGGGGASAPFAYTTTAAAACPGPAAASPASGVVGSTVFLTGTFNATPAFVRFNTGAIVAPLPGATVSTASVTVPAGATSGPIHVYTAAGQSTGAFFTVTTTTVAPTITGFSPSCGPVGTAVTVTGTNLAGATSLRFNGTAATLGTNTGTSIATTVPTAATTGLISVTTPGGTASSPTSFTIPCGAGGTALARTVSFGFDPNSRVSGQVNVTNGTTPCHSLVPVIIQKQKGSTWKWADTTATRKSGSFKTYIPPSHGNFRAKVNQITLANGVVCGKSISNVVHS